VEVEKSQQAVAETAIANSSRRKSFKSIS